MFVLLVLLPVSGRSWARSNRLGNLISTADMEYPEGTYMTMSAMNAFNMINDAAYAPDRCEATYLTAGAANHAVVLPVIVAQTGKFERVCIYIRDDIGAGHEITMSYGWHFWSETRRISDAQASGLAPCGPLPPLRDDGCLTQPVTDGDGVELIPSSRNSTGFEGVRSTNTWHKSRHKQGSRWHSIERFTARTGGGGSTSLGLSFATPIEAAAAYKRAKVAKFATRLGVTTDTSEPDKICDVHPQTQVELHLSAKWKTGYEGVIKKGGRRVRSFEARYGGQQVKSSDGDTMFFTARDAAAAYAAHVAGLQQPLSQPQRKRNKRKRTAVAASGVPGVYHTGRERYPWRATARVNGRLCVLGVFSTVEEAAAAIDAELAKLRPQATTSGCTDPATFTDGHESDGHASGFDEYDGPSSGFDESDGEDASPPRTHSRSGSPPSSRPSAPLVATGLVLITNSAHGLELVEGTTAWPPIVTSPVTIITALLVATAAVVAACLLGSFLSTQKKKGARVLPSRRVAAIGLRRADYCDDPTLRQSDYIDVMVASYTSGVSAPSPPPSPAASSCSVRDAVCLLYTSPSPRDS